nr:hypothetical protein GCM10025730_27150 [Promicromonospora thailandica]
MVVRGTAGEIELEYENDVVRLRTGRGTAEKRYGRTGLLENLLRARTGEPLLCDVRDTGAFMRVLEAVRTAPDPAPIADEFVRWAEAGVGQGNPEGDTRHPVVRDVAAWCERAACEQRTFTELGAPWTAPPR